LLRETDGELSLPISTPATTPLPHSVNKTRARSSQYARGRAGAGAPKEIPFLALLFRYLFSSDSHSPPPPLICSCGIFPQSSDLMSSDPISPLEVTRGGAQMLEALQFASIGSGSATRKRRLHLDLGPHSVYVTIDGQWRLGGWGFSLEIDTNEVSTPCPYFLSGDKNTASGVPVGPRLVYAAPELTNAAVPGGGPAGLTGTADIFSLGLILGECFRGPVGSQAETGAATAPLLSGINEKSPFSHREAAVEFLAASSIRVRNRCSSVFDSLLDAHY
jgi:hypothetical protein